MLSGTVYKFELQKNNCTLLQTVVGITESINSQLLYNFSTGISLLCNPSCIWSDDITTPDMKASLAAVYISCHIYLLHSEVAQS